MPLKSRLFRLVTTVGLTGFLAFTVAGVASAAVENYRLDTGHSTIGYSVRHFVSNFTSTFPKFKGTIAFDPADYKTTSVEVTIWANALSSGNPKRDEHLKSPDFFNAAVDSLITFKSTACVPTGKDTGTLTGNLTMRGVTKPITLNYTVLGYFAGPRGKKAGFEATGTVNKKDFGIDWNNEIDPGNFMLGDEVRLNLQIEANQIQPEGAATPPPPAGK